jgi:hypothetical protein
MGKAYPAVSQKVSTSRKSLKKVPTQKMGSIRTDSPCDAVALLVLDNATFKRPRVHGNRAGGYGPQRRFTE